MTHPFSGLRFGAPKVEPIRREFNGHNITVELRFEQDNGSHPAYLVLQCDGQDVDMYYRPENVDILLDASCCNDFDNENVARVLEAALARHLAGKAAP